MIVAPQKLDFSLIPTSLLPSFLLLPYRTYRFPSWERSVYLTPALHPGIVSEGRITLHTPAPTCDIFCSFSRLHFVSTSHSWQYVKFVFTYIFKFIYLSFIKFIYIMHVCISLALKQHACPMTVGVLYVLLTATEPVPCRYTECV